MLAAGTAHAMNYTLVHRTPFDAGLLERQNAEILPLASGLARMVSSSASVVSPVIEAPSAFDDLVGSWNAELPKGSALEMQVRVRRGADWSDWFSLGRAEPDRWYSAERQDGPFGFVDVDTLKLREKAAAFQYRFLFSAQKKPAVLKLAAVTVSDGEPSEPIPYETGPWTTELRVKARSQTDEQEQYKHDVCSPTSMGMALEYWGVRKRTSDLAEKVRDARTAIFGHWPFNVASAADYGIEAWVARLNSLRDLELQVADERPVIVSITFGLGELDGAPIKKTKGHILVVIGFTPKGDVVVLDPAAPRASARRVYDRRQFHNAWIGRKRGLAYILSPLQGRRLAVSLPVADLMEKPRQRRKADLDDDEHMSQLLYGEIVQLERAHGDWARVQSVEQPEADGKLWHGYRGWVRADALTASLPTPTNAVVRTRQALAQRGQEIVALSVGTRLTRVSESSGVAHVRLLDGSYAEMPSDALFSPPARSTTESRSQIIKTAELFLGTSYYWGGRSGVQPELSIGVDCSGLVGLAYRVHGLDVPRDAHDQMLQARTLKRAQLRPGDLVFLTEPGKPKLVSHVMIFTGGDSLLESRKSSMRTLRSSFKERFGKPLSELESGDEVQDLTFPKPKKRRIYFGGYL
jgi:cell wall-associated NlpC family hydrolase